MQRQLDRYAALDILKTAFKYVTVPEGYKLLGPYGGRSDLDPLFYGIVLESRSTNDARPTQSFFKFAMDWRETVASRSDLLLDSINARIADAVNRLKEKEEGR